MASAVRAQEPPVDIGVRSTVVDKPLPGPFAKSGLQPAPEHGKIYGILWVKPVPTDQKLVKPVNEAALMQLLSYELNTHGYRLYGPGQDPQIVLTVFYGRGRVSNPYMKDAGRESPAGAGAAGMGGGAPADAPTYTITGIPTQGMKEKGNGFEAKSQKAQYEKIFIRVTAYEYPADPKAKARQLWNTTMVADDPDHRDLNEIAQKMLEAGAPYFDKDIKEEEVDVYQPVPEGHVKVGTPEVVEPKSK